MKRLLKQSVSGISFMNILLDETLCEGEILIDKELVRMAGGINKKLPAKQKYECILRIAKNMPVEFVSDFAEEDARICFSEEKETGNRGWKTDCYVIGKYSAILQENKVFEVAVSAVLEEAAHMGRYEETISFLEKMIAHTEEYYELDNSTRPILIYKGDDVCHNVLTVFAEQFGTALEKAGNCVEYFDVGRQPIEELLLYRNQYFKAIIGVQSYLFSVKMKDEVHYLHEYIWGPKFNFIFDHPVWMKKHLEHQYPDFYVLTHDKDYVSFIQKYWKKKAYLFPPAGIEAEPKEVLERIYDLTFVGTIGNYWNEVLRIRKMERKKRFLANRFLLIMRKRPNLSAEEALKRALKVYNVELDEESFVAVLYELRHIIYCVMHYYRHKVLQEILESGIRLDVFGNSWAESSLAKYPNLICHPDVTVEESLTIWKQSKLSLNIMSWHKAGFTERMANIMLAGAVLVTDDSRCLINEYDERDMLIFRLEEQKTLPDRIKQLLLDEDTRKKIAENGQRKTRQKHTWDVRAKEFIELLELKNA